MSITPIWDATLADAPVNIWQAANIFPQPTIITDRALCDVEPRAYIPTRVPKQLYADPTSWIKEKLDIELTDWQRRTPRYKAKVLGEFAVDNPANLSFLGSVA